MCRINIPATSIENKNTKNPREEEKLMEQNTNYNTSFHESPQKNTPAKNEIEKERSSLGLFLEVRDARAHSVLNLLLYINR